MEKQRKPIGGRVGLQIVSARMDRPLQDKVEVILHDAVHATKLSMAAGRRLVLRKDELSEGVQKVIGQVTEEYYYLLSDWDAIVWMVRHANLPKEEAQKVVNGYRQAAAALGVGDKVRIFADVLPGCEFKEHAPKMGPTLGDFKHLQDWDIDDPVTDHCLVLWVPMPLPQSRSKSVVQQQQVIAAFKAQAQLPDWHNVSFGSANQVAGMALAHFKATKESPFDTMVVRTDTHMTLHKDNGSAVIRAESGKPVKERLVMDWHNGRLCCEARGSDVLDAENWAVFAVGVVNALE